MDTSMGALTKSIATIGTSFEEFKATNDQIIASLQKGNEGLAAEMNQKLAKIETDLKTAVKLKSDIETEIALQRERLEELESRARSPGKTAEEKARDDHLEAWIGSIRTKFQDADWLMKLSNISKKDVTIGSAAGGGYAVPEMIAAGLSKMELKYSPTRRLVKVVRVSTGDYKELLDITGASAGWVGESGSRSATNTAQLREIIPTFGELYAYPQASEWSLDDIAFDVPNWIAESVSDQFAIQEGTAVISGNGTSKPTGMLNTAPVATADFASPLRAAAAYQFVPCLATGSPLVATIEPDCLIDLQYSLNSRYRANATWVMNSNTAGAVRKMKDSTGQYLWQPSLQVGQPNILLGYPVETWEQMDDVGTNGLPVAFGDFNKGYLLVDRTGLRLTVDSVTNVGFVRFYIRRRVGGMVLNNDAIKFLKTTIA